MGMNFITNRNIVRVPADRIRSTLKLVFERLDQTSLTARGFLSLLGVLGAAADLLVLGRLHLRPLQTYLLFLWRPHFHSLDAVIPLTSFFKRHLRWWALESRYIEGVPLKVAPPSRFLTTDASLEGWGAHLDPQGVVFSRSLVSADQATTHQRARAPGSLAEPSGSSQVSDRLFGAGSVGQLDSRCLYNKQGGTRSVALCLLTRQILLWCLEHRVVLSAIHIAGKSKCFSRLPCREMGRVPNEWTLDQSACNAGMAL